MSNQFTGNWRDYNMFLRKANDDHLYITGYHIESGKQLRTPYLLRRTPIEDLDIPNSIEELNNKHPGFQRGKSGKVARNLWMKDYMRMSRHAGGETRGSRASPKKRFRDSQFRGKGGIGNKESKQIERTLIKQDNKERKKRIKAEKEIAEMKGKLIKKYKYPRHRTATGELIPFREEDEEDTPDKTWRDEFPEGVEFRDVKLTGKQKNELLSIIQKKQRLEKLMKSDKVKKDTSKMAKHSKELEELEEDIDKVITREEWRHKAGAGQYGRGKTKLDIKKSRDKFWEYRDNSNQLALSELNDKMKSQKLFSRSNLLLDPKDNDDPKKLAKGIKDATEWSKRKINFTYKGKNFSNISPEEIMKLEDEDTGINKKLKKRVKRDFDLQKDYEKALRDLQSDWAKDFKKTKTISKILAISKKSKDKVALENEQKEIDFSSSAEGKKVMEKMRNEDIKDPAIQKELLTLYKQYGLGALSKDDRKKYYDMKSYVEGGISTIVEDERSKTMNSIESLKAPSYSNPPQQYEVVAHTKLKRPTFIDDHLLEMMKDKTIAGVSFEDSGLSKTQYKKQKEEFNAILKKKYNVLKKGSEGYSYTNTIRDVKNSEKKLKKLKQKKKKKERDERIKELEKDIERKNNIIKVILKKYNEI